LSLLSPVVAAATATDGTGALVCLGVGGLVVGGESRRAERETSACETGGGGVGAGLPLAGSWGLIDGAAARRAVGRLAKL
jgi:hypothetical protein